MCVLARACVCVCVCVCVGVVQTQATAADGLRFSTSRAFLYPVLHRDNLHVADDAHVTKVHMNSK